MTLVHSGQGPHTHRDADKPVVSDLKPLSFARPEYTINLRDLGFVGTVSEEARERIRELDRRAMMVLTTSDRFWFR